jgi:hypothetical protein
MKAILWGGIALLTLLWTSGAALLAKTVHWSAKRMTAESTMTFEMATSSVVIPVWLAAWFDPMALSTILETMQDMLGTFSSVLPTVGMVMAWLIPAIWITWALGMLILLGLFVVGTLTLKRMQKIG